MFYELLTKSGQGAQRLGPHTAGVAFGLVPITELPVVRAEGQMRPFAQALPTGVYDDGSMRISRDFPQGDLPDAAAFRRGYFEQMHGAVREQLQAIDWGRAKPTHPAQVPRLSDRLYDELDALARADFAGAAALWSAYCPHNYATPIFLDPEWKRQMSGVQAMRDALKLLDDKDAPSEKKVAAARAIAAVASQVWPSTKAREEVSRAVVARIDESFSAAGTQPRGARALRTTISQRE